MRFHVRPSFQKAGRLGSRFLPQCHFNGALARALDDSSQKLNPIVFPLLPTKFSTEKPAVAPLFPISIFLVCVCVAGAARSCVHQSRIPLHLPPPAPHQPQTTDSRNRVLFKSAFSHPPPFFFICANDVCATALDGRERESAVDDSRVYKVF